MLKHSLLKLVALITKHQIYKWANNPEATQKKELKNGLTIKKLKKQAVPVVIQNFIEIFFQFDS